MNWARTLTHTRTHAHRTWIQWELASTSKPLHSTDSNGKKSTLYWYLKTIPKKKTIYVTILIGCHTKCFNVVFYVVCVCLFACVWYTSLVEPPSVYTRWNLLWNFVCLLSLFWGDCERRSFHATRRATIYGFFVCSCSEREEIIAGICFATFFSPLGSKLFPFPFCSFAFILAVAVAHWLLLILATTMCHMHTPFYSCTMNFIKIYFGNTHFALAECL